MLTLLNMALQGLLVVGGAVALFLPGGLVPGLVLGGAGVFGTILAWALWVHARRVQAAALSLGRVGHELRTPVAVMTAWLDQWRTSSEGESPDPEVLDRQIRRMRVMVEGTLQGTRRLGRVRTGGTSAPCLRRGGSGLALTRVAADLGQLWPGPEEAFPDKAAGGIAVPRLRWSIDGLDDLAQAPGDDRFHHILANILQNAFRHGIPRARPLVRPWEVSVRMARLGAHALEVVVEDEGPGVWVHPLTGIPRSLDPETRRSPGTGLGFYLVRELVASAGGTLTLGARLTSGRPVRGTRVRVVLPIEEWQP